jgi:hypothetical protein
MITRRIIGSLALATALLITGGCEKQPLSPVSSNSSGTRFGARTVAADGPILCFNNAALDTCYPTAGYCPCPETEIPYEVQAGSQVTMNWHAEPQAGTEIRSYRWALDIADVTDETPRIDEATDLSHWSAPSLTATSATLGPWNSGDSHRLYAEVTDSQGFKSLGIVRFNVVAATSNPPDCSAAVAHASTWPPNHKFVPVTISNVTDPDGDPVTITVTNVTQDEPLQCAGDNTCPDATIENGAAKVRAERLGSGNGRVYTIWFTATDSHGLSCEGSADVRVPHDQGHGHSCIKDDRVVNSLGPCGDGVQASRE